MRVSRDSLVFVDTTTLPRRSTTHSPSRPLIDQINLERCRRNRPIEILATCLSKFHFDVFHSAGATRQAAAALF